MSNVFLKNTTSSAITVAGYTVHYIDSADAEIVEVAPLYEEVTLYLLGGQGYRYDRQRSVTSEYSGSADSNYLYSIYTNEGLSNAALYDSTKRYELGSYQNGVWVPFDIQSLSDMPSYTVSISGNITVATLLYNDNGVLKFWPVTNCRDNPGGFNYSYSPVPITVRIYSLSGGSTVRYNAFKYTLNGTPYWYVIDGTHEDWTDDLSSIGYSEVPSVVLPTVSEAMWCRLYNRIQDQYGIIEADGTKNCYVYSGGFYTIPYDSAYLYSIYGIYSRYNYNIGNTQLSPFNNDGLLAVRNVTQETLEISGFYVCTCDNTSATVVTVYNSSNVAYNAFKYTASGTDYYYVLDGTQTDWVTDLSGIGYYLPVVRRGYFLTSKMTVTYS